MLDEHFAKTFAADWIDAWNAHDLDRILAHYAEDFTMSSPFIRALGLDASGTLAGKVKVGAYWRAALERMPDLRFELIDVTVGAGSLAVYYTSVMGKKAVEVFFFGEDEKVVRAYAHYDSI
jgi:ketosteroid isomerase-like protein